MKFVTSAASYVFNDTMTTLVVGMILGMAMSLLAFVAGEMLSGGPVL